MKSEANELLDNLLDMISRPKPDLGKVRLAALALAIVLEEAEKLGCCAHCFTITSEEDIAMHQATDRN